MPKFVVWLIVTGIGIGIGSIEPKGLPRVGIDSDFVTVFDCLVRDLRFSFVFSVICI